jgi:hypothetical protein
MRTLAAVTTCGRWQVGQRTKPAGKSIRFPRFGGSRGTSWPHASTQVVTSPQSFATFVAA